MSDDNVITMQGTEDDPVDKKVELEKLNTLLDATSGALQDAAIGGLSPDEKKGCLSRAKRLQGELERVLGALGVE